jgi:hypothetical protein
MLAVPAPAEEDARFTVVMMRLEFATSVAVTKARSP